MAAFLVRRALLALVTGFSVLTLVFVIVRILPGDPARGDPRRFRVRGGAQHASREPRPQQAPFDPVCGLPRRRGDRRLGPVDADRADPVIEEILNVLPWTIELTLVSLALAAVVGIPLGVWAAVHRNRWPDYVTRIGSLLGLSFPAFVSAVILLLYLLDPVALVSGDQRANGRKRAPGFSRSRCRPSASASSWRPTSRA